jgi:hypothetical protein
MTRAAKKKIVSKIPAKASANTTRYKGENAGAAAYMERVFAALDTGKSSRLTLPQKLNALNALREIVTGDASRLEKRLVVKDRKEYSKRLKTLAKAASAFFIGTHVVGEPRECVQELLSLPAVRETLGYAVKDSKTVEAMCASCARDVSDAPHKLCRDWMSHTGVEES